MDTGDKIESYLQPKNARHEPSQLDSKQSHAWFDYDEDDRTKFFPASDAQTFLIQGSTTLDSTEHLENLDDN